MAEAAVSESERDEPGESALEVLIREAGKGAEYDEAVRLAEELKQKEPG
jgi:hypothetical protein